MTFDKNAPSRQGRKGSANSSHTRSATPIGVFFESAGQMASRRCRTPKDTMTRNKLKNPTEGVMTSVKAPMKDSSTPPAYYENYYGVFNRA